MSTSPPNPRFNRATPVLYVEEMNLQSPDPIGGISRSTRPPDRAARR